MSGDREEQFILRCQDPAVAERIRRVLREDPAAAPADAQLEIHFDGAAPAQPSSFWSTLGIIPMLRGSIQS